jgi:hypothetical protein
VRLLWLAPGGLAVAPMVDGVLGAPAVVPGAAGTAAFAATPGGEEVAAWVGAGGTLTTSSRTAGGRFSAPEPLPGPSAGYARDVQATTSTTGDVLIAFLASRGSGNAVAVARRPEGGSFGEARLVVPAGEGARAPAIAGATHGEIDVSYVASGITRAWGFARGALRLRRLDPLGVPRGRLITFTRGAQRTSGAGLAVDPSGTFVVWSVDGAVRARRLAPGGILGSERILSHVPAIQVPVVAGGPTGGAAAAWISRGRVRVARYRAGENL